MSKGRCLGLVGGLGTGAAIHYYLHIAKAHERSGRVLDLVMVNADMERALRFMEEGDTAGFAEYLAGTCARLQAAGADFAAIPSVTANSCTRELARISPLPLVSIYDPVRDELARRNWRRVALFGTRFTMDSALYGFVEGVNFVLPEPEEVDLIHATYIQLARDGFGTPEQHHILTMLAHTLLARENLDAIILAGTDLSLLFNKSNTDFPHLDCAKLHIEAIVREMMD